MSKETECLEKVLKDPKYKDLPEDIARDLAEDVAHHIRNSPNVNEAFKKIKNMTPEKEAWLKLTRAKDRLVSKDTLARVDQKLKEGREGELVEEKVIGLTETGEGFKDSYVNEKDTLERLHISAVDKEIGQFDELLFKQPTLVKEAFVALDKINKGIEVAAGTAKDMALAIQRFNKYIVNELRKGGIDVRDRADYIVRQVHSQDLLIKAKFKGWRDFIINKLDEGKTFGNVKDPIERDKILENIYFDITSHGGGGQGPGSITRARKLHFKNGESLYEYMIEFSGKNLKEIMYKTARNAARAEAKLKFFGSRPDKLFETIDRRIKKELENSKDTARFNKYEEGAKRRKQILDHEVLGFGEVEGTSWTVNALKNSRQLAVISKLGAAFTTTGTDLSVSTANYMAKTGEGFWKSLGVNIKGWTKVLKTKEDLEKFRQVYMTSLGYDTSRYDVDTGKLKKITNTSMKVLFLDQTTKQNREASMYIMATKLTDEADLNKSFGQLDPRTQAMMKDYSIDSKQWEEIKASERLEVPGHDGGPSQFIINPENIESRDLKLKFHSMMWSNAKKGAISPDAYTKMMATFGINPDTVLGQAAAAVTQFKTFPLQLSRTLDELIKSNPNADNTSKINALKDVSNQKLIGMLAVSSYFTALAGLYLRDLLLGKVPRNLDMKTAREAFTRGVIPLKTQYLFDTFTGEYANYNRSLVADLAGPTASLADDTAELISKFGIDSYNLYQDGDTRFKKSRGAALRLVRRNLPFVNSPIIAPLFDSFFFNNLMESARPGYKNRMIKRDMKRGQEYLAPVKSIQRFSNKVFD